MKLAIIGTAGRGPDSLSLTVAKWNDMKRIVARFIKEQNIKHVVSGGAAFSDHMAVGVYLAGLVEKLDLYFPCKFDTEKVEFYDSGSDISFVNPGGVANFYHEHFSKKMGIKSLLQIKQAIDKGAFTDVKDGFHARNVFVAKADMVIAFTFGNGAVVKDGGTAHTCREYLKSGKKQLFHVDLSTMTLYDNATV